MRVSVSTVPAFTGAYTFPTRYLIGSYNPS